MSANLKPAVSKQDHIQGNSDAAIELVEYGDYQCPYCGQAYGMIKYVQQKMGANLKFIFRNFPLSEMHPNATAAAIAAEAAGLQNKYWEMHDVLYENQANLEPEALFAYAKKIGLNLQKFKEDVQSDTLSTKVEADLESGVRSGVNGTPSFFINGQKYEGDWEGREFTRYLKAYLANLKR